MKYDNKTIGWLLEEDNPTVKFLTLKHLTKSSSKEVEKARKEALSKGTANQVLKHMNPEGYWVKKGAGYSPKYKSTVWSLINLAQIGANIKDDPRIKKGCNYYLDNAYSKGGFFGHAGNPSGYIDCLQGNMCGTLLDLGVKDKRLDGAFELMARYVTGEGISPAKDKEKLLRYYSYKCGPEFACGANEKKPCSWGAVKVMFAFSKLPKSKQTLTIKKAIKEGCKFLLKYDLVKANYPTRGNTPPNRSWQKFGFPVFYVADILQNVEALVNLGYASHPKVSKAIEFILNKKDKDDRWNLNYNYNDKTWANWVQMRKPNKWVTYRVYKVLKSVNI